MKVLLLTDEVWNDRVHGNNVLSNWFDGFPAEFAQIYCSPGNPLNNCCHRYFQITDKMMIRSIFMGEKAGRYVTDMETETCTYNSTDIEHIGFFRKHGGNLLRFCKNIVWTMGRYDLEKIERFITDFSPNVIFTPRLATPKLLRLERIIKQYANCPMIAFTGDNEFSLKILSFSPIAWINRFWVRKELRKNACLYSLYYTLSDEQKEEYEKAFSFPVKILRKCAQISSQKPSATVHTPIRLVYAGKLYCNRWKTLALIGKAIQKINENGQKLVLDIYTKDNLHGNMKEQLQLKDAVVIHGPILSNEVLRQYQKSDIALHIESFDLTYRYATRLSFSTKIVDCLGGGCAVLVVAWKHHSGLTYLQREDAAICISCQEDILPILTKLCKNKDCLLDYKQKAYACLERNHNKENIQLDLENDLRQIMNT